MLRYSWLSMLKLVLLSMQEADGILGSLVSNPDRAARVDFTSAHIWTEPYTLVVPKPKQQSRIFAFIRPFQPMVHSNVWNCQRVY